MPGDRKCSTCLEVKSADQFEKKGNQCRECTRARARARYAENPEKYRAKNRARYRRNSTRPRQERPWGYRRPGSETYLCTRCGLTKDADCFDLTYTGRSLRSHCRECRVEDSRWRSVARKYGLSRAQYGELFASQGGVCAICKKPPSASRQLAVDHDHRCCPEDMTCGKCIRGLLCTDCNYLLGQAGDDPEILRSAAAYLGPARVDDNIAAHPAAMPLALQHCA